MISDDTTLRELMLALEDLGCPRLEVWWAPGIESYCACLGGSHEELALRLGILPPDRIGRGPTVAHAIEAALVKFKNTRDWTKQGMST